MARSSRNVSQDTPTAKMGTKMKKSKPKKAVKPFGNATMEVGGLTIDNAQDRVAIFGSVDITRDAEGLAHAKRLAEFFAALAGVLADEQEGGKLPEKLEVLAPEVKDNPLL